MPKINAKPDSVESLLQALPSGSLPARYLKLLRRCREKGYPVGAMEEVVQAEALSDWDAAACLPGGEITLGDIEEAREQLNEHGQVVVEHDHRKGKEAYVLSEQLLD